MSRAPRIFTVAALFMALSAAAWAFDTEETQQIRELLYKAKKGWYEGDPALVISCFAEGVVLYQATENPETWAISVGGLDSLRAMQNALVKQGAQTWADHPDWRRDHEVLHIGVKGDYAIATTQHWESKPDSSARETIQWEGKAIWMLAKTKGEWKVTSMIGGIGYRQDILKWNPE